ncbi:hypothetical protein BDQ12DRAFT_653026, partial [Crucibulum laeve]
MSSQSNIPILNPLTPLAFVPPDEAYGTTVAKYILVGTFAVFIWDSLHWLYQDYLLLFKTRIGLSTAIYFLSRICTFGFALTSTLYGTAPLVHCATVQKIINGFILSAIPLTSFLFFLRVHAIFNRNKYVSGAFFILWLGILAFCLSLVNVIEGINFGPTDY